MFRNLILCSLLFSLCSCDPDKLFRTEETIEAKFVPKTAAEQQRESQSTFIKNNLTTEDQAKLGDDEIIFAEIKYYFNDIEVDDEAEKMVGNIPVISRIGKSVMDFLVGIQGGVEVESEAMKIDLSDIDDETLELVAYARIKELYLEILNNPGDQIIGHPDDHGDLVLPESATEEAEANLKNEIRKEIIEHDMKFLKYLEVRVVTGEGEKQEEEKILLFDSSDDEHRKISEGCEWKCVDLEATDRNLLEFITIAENGEKYIMIKPIVKIGTVPDREYYIGGAVEAIGGVRVDMKNF